MRSHLRPYARWGTLVAAGGLTLVAMGPALAAGAVSQSGANAAQLSIAGQGQGTGTVTATNDGSTETKQGETAPPIGVLKNQKLLNAGVAAQEARALSSGKSAACAGLGGPGASVARVGGTVCLTPGDQLGMFVTNLDFSKTLVVDPDSALEPLAEANDPLRTALTTTSDPLADGVAETPVGTGGFGGSTRAIDASCTAEPGKASGTAHLTDAKLTMNVAGQELVLANLPANPPPNTVVPIHLEKATGAILGAVETHLNSMFAAPGAASGPLAPLAALPKALQDQVITALVDATRDQLLTAIDANLFHLVLNKQTRTGDDSIKVSALDLEVLPAAKQQIGASLVQLQIGNVACGPNGAPKVPTSKHTPNPGPTGLPTAVSAGALGAGPVRAGDDSHNGTVLAAFAILLAGGVGVIGLRRLHG